MGDKNSLQQEKKNLFEKLKTQISLGVIKNIENFEHNSPKNDDFDDKRIRNFLKPVWNLDDNNCLPQEKKLC